MPPSLRDIFLWQADTGSCEWGAWWGTASARYSWSLKEWVIRAFPVRFHLRLKVHGHICLHHTEHMVWK